MTSKEPSQIHRLPIFDSQSNPTGNYALLAIRPDPSSTWPLQIEATEGNASYRTKVSRTEISSLRDRRNQKSKDEWESVVLQCLLRKTNDVVAFGAKDLEVFVTLDEHDPPQELSVVIRKKIGEVKQRLGEIPARLDESDEVDVVEWCHAAVQYSNTLAAEQSSLQSKFSDQQNMISDLNKRLEDLVAAKKEHENALLSKFCEILNTKKLKIRDQQRLLATVTVDQAEAAKVRESRKGGHVRASGRSAKGKRKAENLAEEEDDDEDGFAIAEASHVEQNQEPDSEEEEARRTDEGSDGADETTDDGDVDDLPAETTRSGVPDRTREEGAAMTGDVAMEDAPAAGKPTTKETGLEKESAEVLEKADEDDETTDDDEL